MFGASEMPIGLGATGRPVASETEMALPTGVG